MDDGKGRLREITNEAALLAKRYPDTRGSVWQVGETIQAKDSILRVWAIGKNRITFKVMPHGTPVDD